MRHSMDRLIKRTLLSFRWFAKWLDGLTAVVSLNRDRRTDTCQSLIKDGHTGSADLVKAAKLKPFACWRWGTLKNDAKEVNNFIRTLSVTLDLEPFRRRSKDPVLIRRVTIVFSSAEW